MSDEGTTDQRRGRTVIGCVGLALAALFTWTTLREYPIGSMARPGAAVFPLVVAAGLAVASVMVLVESYRQPAESGALGLEWRHVRRAAGVLGILIVYLAVMPVLGFVLATIGFLLVMLRLLTTTSWVRISAGAVVTAIVFYGLFAVLFAVPLPIGIFNIG